MHIVRKILSSEQKKIYERGAFGLWWGSWWCWCECWWWWWWWCRDNERGIPSWWYGTTLQITLCVSSNFQPPRPLKGKRKILWGGVRDGVNTCQVSRSPARPSCHKIGSLQLNTRYQQRHDFKCKFIPHNSVAILQSCLTAKLPQHTIMKIHLVGKTNPFCAIFFRLGM